MTNKGHKLQSVGYESYHRHEFSSDLFIELSKKNCCSASSRTSQ